MVSHSEEWVGGFSRVKYPQTQCGDEFVTGCVIWQVL